MTDYVWPTDLIPNASEWRLVANTAAFASPLSGSTRTLARGGDRWACSMQFNALTGAERARLQGFLARLRGQANRAWLWDHAYRRRGTFPTSELLPDIGASLSAWTLNTNVTGSSADGVARLHRSITAAGALLYKSTAVAVGNAYGMRVALAQSNNTDTANMTISNGAFDTTLKTGAATGAGGGVSFDVWTASEASPYVTGNASVGTAGNYYDFSLLSLARCALVLGASQTGSRVAANGLPVSSTGILLAGDMVQIGNDRHMLTATLSSDSGGNGVMHITPPLRSSPANGAAIQIYQPLCKMMLADQTVGWSNVPGTRTSALSSITVEFVEDLL